MEGQIWAISRNMEGQETSDSYHIKENSKNISFYAHILMYAGLRSKAAYTREYGFKSRVQQ